MVQERPERLRRTGTPEFLGKYHSDVQENVCALETYFGALGKSF